MKFFSSISRAENPDDLLRDLTVDAGDDYDWAVVFFSGRPTENILPVLDSIRKRCGVRRLLACSASGVIGQGQEMEVSPSTSLFLASCPGTKVIPFYLDQPRLMALEQPADWHQFFGIQAVDSPIFMALADPFSLDVNRFVAGINQAYSGCPLVGGLCSAAAEAGGNLLCLDGETWREGCVGLALAGGDLKVEILVSQGCRPVGEHYIITAAQRNVIQALAGQPFLQIVRQVFESASAQDRTLIQQALFVGLAMDEYKYPYERGDFLIRGVLGIDETTGAGVIGDVVRSGQTIQLQVRDAKTAEEDLLAILQHYRDLPGPQPQGALLFSCNGRGQDLFGCPHHDVTLIRKFLGSFPISGFFCGGELGPVGGRNFIHGFTDCLVLFHF